MPTSLAQISSAFIATPKEKPPNHPGKISDSFGHDLIEEATQISALTNCGGFPESFSKDELNQYGLVTSFERACEIRHALAKINPNEPHAQCELYAIWRLQETAH